MPNPESEPKISYEETTEKFEVPDSLKDEMRPVDDEFKAKVTNTRGQNVIETPETKKITIEIPGQEKTFRAQGKGSITESITWRAKLFLRKIKQALHFGWKLVFKGGQA